MKCFVDNSVKVFWKICLQVSANYFDSRTTLFKYL